MEPAILKASLPCLSAINEVKRFMCRISYKEIVKFSGKMENCQLPIRKRYGAYGR